MRFKEAVQHLQGLGLVVEGAGGQAHSGGRRQRGAVQAVPVREAKNGMLPPDLVEMIRESRAQLNGSRRRKVR